MKTKTKALFAIGLFAAFCIGFLIGIFVDYPKTDKSELAGTFGKAEKFRKVQMTSKDIQLRSEFLKDTAQLRSMIQGLVYFSVFTEEVSASIDMSVMLFKTKGMGTQARDADKMGALQDYSAFIRNNNKTLNATISLLTGFYLKDSTNLSQDVEKNLRDFGSYVNTLNEKFSAINDALLTMDNFMLGNKTLQAHQKEIIQLKSIRDQLLIKGVQLGGILRNKKEVTDLVSYALSAQEKLGLLGNEKLSFAQARENLQLIFSQGSIQSALYSTQTVSAIANQDLGAAVLLYDQSGLQFIILDKAQLNAGATANLQSLAIFGTEKLYIVLQTYSLQDVLQSNLLSGYLAANTLNLILSMNNLQVVILSTGGIDSMINLLANQGLGVKPPSSD